MGVELLPEQFGAGIERPRAEVGSPLEYQPGGLTAGVGIEHADAFHAGKGFIRGFLMVVRPEIVEPEGRRRACFPRFTGVE
jgi:hypothetical protein